MRTDVARHDHDGVLEVDMPTKRIGQPSFLHDL